LAEGGAQSPGETLEPDSCCKSKISLTGGVSVVAGGGGSGAGRVCVSILSLHWIAALRFRV